VAASEQEILQKMYSAPQLTPKWRKQHDETNSEVFEQEHPELTESLFPLLDQSPIDDYLMRR
jgi:hypothetical protein